MTKIFKTVGSYSSFAVSNTSISNNTIANTHIHNWVRHSNLYETNWWNISFEKYAQIWPQFIENRFYLIDTEKNVNFSQIQKVERFRMWKRRDLFCFQSEPTVEQI